MTLPSSNGILAVLKRDGSNVVTDSACKATSGNWVSAYDGIATNLASDLDIVSAGSNSFSILTSATRRTMLSL